MKLAFIALTPDVTNPAALGYRGDLASILSLFKDLGYQGVELMARDPRVLDWADLERTISRAGLEVPMVCTGEVYGQDKVSFTDPDGSVREEALRRLKAFVELAGRLGAQINIGRSRGGYFPGVPAATTEEWALQGFRELATHGEKLGVTIALEPVNHLQVNFIQSTREGMAWVDRVGMPNFRLMLDLLHMNIEDDESIEDSIRTARGYFTHVHVCDANRKPPGRGHLRFAPIVRALADTGYNGYLSGEMLNYPDQDTAVRETIAHLKPLLG